MQKLIVCDWNRTLFDPETNQLYGDTIPFLETLKDNYFVLVSTNKIDTAEQFNNFSINQYFSKIFFNVEKNVKLFSHIRSQFPDCDPWVIGDRINSEIKIGNMTCYTTIRIRRGKFANDIPICDKEKPNFTVNNLSEALPVLLS